MATPIPALDIPGDRHTEDAVDVSDLKTPLVEPEKIVVSFKQLYDETLGV